MSECQNNDTCYEYDKVQMWANHRDGAVSLCLNEVGSCVDAAACQLFSDYGDIPFSDTTGSGYQTGPCSYIPSSSDWSTYVD